MLSPNTTTHTPTNANLNLSHSSKLKDKYKGSGRNDLNLNKIQTDESQSQSLKYAIISDNIKHMKHMNTNSSLNSDSYTTSHKTSTEDDFTMTCLDIVDTRQSRES